MIPENKYKAKSRYFVKFSGGERRKSEKCLKKVQQTEHFLK